MSDVGQTVKQAAGPPTVSFEFFPPGTEPGWQTLFGTIGKLAPFAPSFVSVTYGAGGSTRERTDRAVHSIQGETGLQAAAHLTCVGADRASIDAIARRFWDAGIHHIVALRGDPPAGDARYRPHPDGYENAAALVAGLRQIGDFRIGVAAYPECHPDSPSPVADMDNLKRKLDAGASEAITQFFFDPAVFLRFRDRAVKAGIDAPLLPGILPVTNFARVVEFSQKCGTSVPAWLAGLFDGLDDDAETRSHVAASVATELCLSLQKEGVDHFHFYTLNRPVLTAAICRRLGLRPTCSEAA